MRESQHCLLLVFSKFGASTNDIPVQRCKSPIVISFGLGLVKASETREQKSRFIRPRSADRVEGSPGSTQTNYRKPSLREALLRHDMHVGRAIAIRPGAEAEPHL